jgi:hypothetical protein
VFVTRRTVLRGLATVVAVPALRGAGRTWHPGHYFPPACAGHPFVTGIKVCLPWGALEGAPGNYAPGFRLVDHLLSTGKPVMVQVGERSGEFPMYTLNNGWVSGRVAAMWRPVVMDRLIALSQAFAARYDSHPRFEQFSLGETDLRVSFSTLAWQTQLKRWFTESKKAWRHTYLRLNANFIGNDAEMRDLITHCVSGGGVTVGGPEPELPRENLTGFVTANRVFRGLDGGADLRGKVPWTGETRTLPLPPREILDYFTNTMRASHFVWPRAALPYLTRRPAVPGPG